MEIANSVEAVQDGRIYIELTGRSCRSNEAEYTAVSNCVIQQEHHNGTNPPWSRDCPDIQDMKRRTIRGYSIRSADPWY